MSSDVLLVLHLTDLHLSADPAARFGGVNAEDGFNRIMDALSRETRRPDLVIATGDLSEDGSEASYARVAAQLRRLGAPVRWTCGNHDHRPTMDRVLQAWGDGGGQRRQGDAGQVVMLNTQVPGESHGWLAPSELAVLETAMRVAPDRPLMVGLHHGPLPVCGMSACRLLNAADLMQRLREHGAPVVVLSGHNHCEADRCEGNVRMLVTPSTCLQLRHPATGEADDRSDFMAVHGLDGSAGAWRWVEWGANGSVATEVRWQTLASAS